MARTFFLLVNVLLCVYHICLSKTCRAEEEEKPSRYLFVFGDSIVDSGPKKEHETGMRAGHSPYGIECQWYGKFRFTNGWTVPDMIALKLNLTVPVSSVEVELFPRYNGVNYASASAGILPETGSALGTNYCMEEQVGFFKETLEKFLRPKFPSPVELSKRLSDSIFVINIGSSDYIFNYLQPSDYNSSRQYNGDAFAELLIRKLGNHLEDLYNLGARKMLIFEIGPLGCLPYIINKFNPRDRCFEDANKLASIFNEKLETKLKELSGKLKGSTFVTAKTFHLIKDIVENPFDYGLQETRWPCCATQENGTGLCKEPKIHYVSPEMMAKLRPADPSYYEKQFRKDYFCTRSPPPPKVTRPRTSIGKPEGDVCEDREAFVFWDELHLTTAVNRIIMDKCFHPASGGICSPYDIYQLANQR
ncbi:GDSL esterase/lipase 7-like [Rhododendron vialii]|uniref:GDSL esterase/lipase 7-like n=1 Tax=Rhododendron vialii TaxID=182163 RepID=UPI00265DF358|nr:GDSL esterase/lipase 7-like [Rhododendron vialii]